MNFFLGDPAHWKPGVETFRQMRYTNIHPGVDLVFLYQDGGLAFQLHIQPGSTLEGLQLTTGADRVSEAAEGGLEAILSTELSLFLQAPRAHQKIAGRQRRVSVAFEPLKQGAFSFILGHHDPGEALTLSSSLSWGTFLGGGAGGEDRFTGMAVDGDGQVVLVGETYSSEFPLSANGYDHTFNGDRDVFVVKMPADGSDVLWGTFLGGSDKDGSIGVSIDSTGQIVVTGNTKSSNFPTTPDAYDRTFNGGGDLFVAVLNPTGMSLTYATLLGGTESDTGSDSCLGGDVLYIVGGTSSDDFPVTTGLTPYQGNGDSFVLRLDYQTSTLLSSRLLGAYATDYATCIALEQDELFIAGYVSYFPGTPFPTTAGAFQTTHSGTEFNRAPDGYITKLAADGVTILYSTLLGSEGTPYGNDGFDNIYDLAVKDGCAFVTGTSDSLHFPVTPGHFGIDQVGGRCLFVTKLNPQGSGLVYSGVIDTPGLETGSCLIVDEQGQAIIAGTHGRLNPDDEVLFPTTPGAYDDSYNLNTDMVLLGISEDGTELIFSTFLGGNQEETPTDLLSFGNDLYLCGTTHSMDFPTTPPAFSRNHQGFIDAVFCVFDHQGTTLKASTLLGGGKKEETYDLKVLNGHPYLVGSIEHLIEFPYSDPSFSPLFGTGATAFVTKMATDGSDFVWSSLFGGNGIDIAYALSASASTLYLTGTTTSTDFPVTSPTWDDSHNGGVDAFVLKISEDGQTLHYSTFLGGIGNDEARGVAVYSDQAFVTGFTSSTTFPTTAGVHDVTHNGGGYDVFLTRMSADGSHLTYSTFLGGSGTDYAYDVAVSSGYATVVGRTSSSNFPTTPSGYDTSYGGNYDAFVSRFTGSGILDYSTFLGGNEPDSAQAVDVNTSQGYLSITGYTEGPFPVTPDAAQANHGGMKDAFVTILHPVIPQTLTYSTYVGGSDDDEGKSIDEVGGVSYIGGTTRSTDLSVTANAPDPAYNGSLDGFVFTVDRTQTSKRLLSYFGGSGDDHLNAIASWNQEIYIAGHTTSEDFPVTAGAYQGDWHAQAAFVAQLAKEPPFLLCPSLLVLWHQQAPGSCLGFPVYSVREYISVVNGTCPCPD
jgi:hypothetical protein